MGSHSPVLTLESKFNKTDQVPCGNFQVATRLFIFSLNKHAFPHQEAKANSPPLNLGWPYNLL